MALFGFRKRRSSRVIPLRPASPFWSALAEPLANRSVWLRVGMCFRRLVDSVDLLGSVATAVSLPHRRFCGSRNRGTRRLSTGRLVQNRSSPIGRGGATPHVFRNDPNSAQPVAGKACEPISAKSPRQRSWATYRVTTRIAFGLTEGNRGERGQSEESIRPTMIFAALRRIVGDRPGLAGNRIDEIVSEFANFIAPLKNRGLADVNEFTLNKIERDQSLAIVTGAGNAPQQIVFPADVQLSELLKPTGTLGKSWMNYPLLNSQSARVRALAGVAAGGDTQL